LSSFLGTKRKSALGELVVPHQWLAPLDISPLLYKKNPDVTTHCFIHKEMLVSKALGDEIKSFERCYKNG
jgi:hypothetical protein